MRTLQEKYNAIQEGKFSKEHFLAEARMQQPQLVTRFNGYDDAVQILKNKGMIVEAKGKEEFENPLKDHSDEYKEVLKKLNREAPGTAEHKKLLSQLNDMRREKGLKPIQEAKLTEAKVYSFTLTYNDAKYVQRVLDDAGVDAVAKAGTFDDEVTIRAFDGMGLRRAKQALEADHFDINENVSEAKQPKATKKGLTDYRYKPTNEMDKYPYEQILRGIRVELETLGVSGTPTAEEYAKALAKVSKNLAKDSIFYTNQVAGVNPKVDLHDKMIPVTAKNTVDTFNGMKKAELKEGFKRLIKKVLSESMGDMFRDEERAERSANYGQPGENEYEFYSDPENYNEAEEEFELQGEEAADDIPHPRGYEEASDEEDLDESKMGDLYITAQESDSLKDFLIKVKQEYPETNLRRDIEELQHIWNNRGEDSEDELSEGKKSLSELLK